MAKSLTLAVFLLSGSLFGHNLDQRDTYIAFDPATLGMMKSRLDANNSDTNPANDVPLIQKDDIVGVILKSTPGPGTSTGFGGYLTFYIPEGTQVVNAEYIQPDGAGGFNPVPMKGPSIAPIGSGPVGATTTPVLAGLQLTHPEPTLGALFGGGAITSVDAGGRPFGTIAGVYGDVGIFFSVDPDTAWQSFATLGGYDGDPGTADNALTNNRGETKVPITKWDAEQLIAFGLSSPASPLIDPNGRGNAPWGLANAVAGPQSSYAWEFDWESWKTNGNDFFAAIEVGPWQRIQYPGSQAAADLPGLESSELGFVGVDASSLGHDLGSAPLPPTIDWNDGSSPTAVRFSYGGLELGRAEYGRVELKILDDAGGPNSPFDANGCFLLHTDAFGGDAGGENGGKDHLWRYYDPTTATINPCAYIQKVASDTIVADGDVFSFQIDVINLGTTALTNVTVSDALPAGLTYVSAIPAPDSTDPLTWNINKMDPNDPVNFPIMRSITLFVKAEGSGEIFNTATLNSNEAVATAQESVQIGSFPLLQPDKTVDQSAVAPGATVTYDLILNNVGSGMSASPIVITENLPDGFTYVGMVSAEINGGALPGVSLSVDSGDLDKPVFTVSQGINADDRLMLRFNVLVSPDQPVGTYGNSFAYEHNGNVVSTGSLAPVTVGGGKIGDTVYRDWDANNTQDAYDEGIAGVTVNLYEDVDNDGIFEPGGDDGAPVATAVTDSDGNYIFLGLTDGPYFVEVDGTSVPSGHTITEDPDGGANGVSRVVLGFNEGNFDQDFGYSPGVGSGSGSIGDLVYEDIGNDGVFGAGDSGINGVTVTLYEDANGNGVVDPEDYEIGTQVTATVTTDGEYSFTGLPEGFDYIAVVDPLDPALLAYFNPDGALATTADPQTIDTLAGDYEDADFGFFRLLPSSIGDEVFIDNDNDGVFGTGDEAIVNATVTLYDDANGNGVLDPGEPAVRTTETGLDGTYLFDILGPGDYIVRIDTTDPDIPGGYFPSAQNIPVNIPIPVGGGTDVITADFPFVEAISKSVDKASAIPGADTLNYTVNVSYPGNELLNNVLVTDLIPAGVTLVDPGTDIGQGGQLGYGSAGMLTLNPSQDAGLEGGGNSDKNYGASTTLKAQSSSKRALFQFDLSSIPAGAELSSAIFRLNVTKKPSTLNIHPVLTSWTEGTGNATRPADGVTWNTNDGSTSWTPGGNYGPSVATLTAAGTGYATVDLTSLVESWLASPGSNHGFIVVETADQAMEFDSRETADPPELVLDYTVGVSYGTDTVVWNLGSNAPGTPHMSAPEEEIITTTKDARVESGGNAAKNWGATVADDGLKVNGGSKLSFIEFDLSAIPAGAVITDAKLRINVDTAKPNDTVGIHPVLLGWTEGSGNGGTTNDGVSWNNYDGSNTWPTAPAGPAGDYGAAAATFVPAATGILDVSVTSLVQGWYGAPATNHGIVLVGTNGDESKYSTEGTANPPKLVVTYVLVGTTTAVSAGPSIVAEGNTLTVNMTLTTDQETEVSSFGMVPTVPAGVTLTPGSSPSTPVTVPANTPTEFTWDYVVSTTGLAAPDSITFDGDATGTTTVGSIPVTWGTATSNSVIVTPPLTFTVSVDDPATVGAIENTAAIEDLKVIPRTNSNPVLTALTGSIGDTVFVDLDGDGVQDPGEPGIMGVEVCATNGVDTYCDITDASGNYRIFGLDMNGGNPWTVTVSTGTIPAGYTPTTPTSTDRTLPTDISQIDDADFGFRLPPVAPASIGDTVWLDKDEDGVFDGSESGLPGVTVNLYSDDNNNGIIDGTDGVVATTTTGPDGSYLFDGLYPGDYIVQVDETSSVDIPQGGTTTLADAMDLVSGSNPLGVPVTLSGGENYLDADFGYNWSGSIGDTTYYDDNGNGMQDPGELNAGGVTILLYEDLNGNGKFDGGEPPAGFVESDPGGNYTFDNLPPGDYVVKFDESTVESPSTPGTYGTMVPTTGEEAAVSLLPGEDYVDADAGFIEAAIVEGHVFHDVNGDGFLGGSEPRLEGVIVTLSGTDIGGNPVSLVVATDTDGEYKFIVPPGTYTVSYDTNDPAIPPADLPAETTTTVYNITASAGDELGGLDFGRDNVGTVGDLIFSDLNGDGGFDTGEPGIGGVTVYLYDDSGSTLLASATTDSNGKYLFTGLADGDYVVVVDTATLPAGYNTTPTVDPDGTFDSEGAATVALGGDDLGMDFGYEPPANAIDIEGTVFEDVDGSGTINGGDGDIGGATVTAEIDFDDDGIIDQVLTTTTAPDGTYIFPGVPVGPDGNVDVTLTVDETTVGGTGFQPTTPAVITLSDIDADSQNNDFGFQEQLSEINGTVVRGDGNGVADPGETALEGVEITLTYAGPDGILGTGDDTTQTTFTNANGDYSFPSLQPGTYQIEESDPSAYGSIADADGGNPGVITIVLGLNETLNGQDFEDAFQFSVGGRVVDDADNDGDLGERAGESGINGVTVELWTDPDGDGDPSDGFRVQTTTTSGNGEYQFDDVVEGDYVVVEIDPDRYLSTNDVDGMTVNSFNEIEVPLSGGDSLANDFLDTRTGVIGNRIWLDEDGDGRQDAGESGLPGVTVLLRNGSGTVIATTTTDLDGGYLFTGLAPADYTVEVDGGSLSPGLNVTGDPDSTLDGSHLLTLPPGGEILTVDFGYNYVPAGDSTAPATGTTGAIGNRVWNDGDGDGVQDPGEPGIAGVTVSLLTDDNGDGIYGGPGDSTPATTATNAHGEYWFDGLVPGSYVVSVTAPAGYTQTGDPDGDLDNATSTPVVLAPGDVFTNADFGYDLDSGGATIGDTIYLDANGNGTHDSGSEPGIPGVTVALLDAGGAVIATTTSDTSGNFFFPGLPTGVDYTVVVTDTGHVLGELSQSGDPDGGNDGRSTVNALAGDDFTQDFGYTPPGHGPGRGLIGDTIFLDADGDNSPDAGEGVEGVTVELYNEWGTTLLATTITDENGNYSFGDLDPAATYTVRVDPAGTILAGLSNSVDPDGGTAGEAVVDLSVTGAITLDQDFGYVPGTGADTIAGTVWDDDNADGTLNETKTGIAGVTVVLRDSGGNVVGTRTTDANGDYSFGNLPDGTYTVDVVDSANVLDGYWHSDGPNDGSDNNSQDDPYTVSVSGGATDATADFGYYVDPAVMGNFVFEDLDGDGIQDTGEPGLPGVVVTLTIDYATTDSVVVTTVTAADGSYSFAGLFDESFRASGGAGEPEYTITVAPPSGYVPALTNQGTDDSVDSDDGLAGEPVELVQGGEDFTNDFGFVKQKPLTYAQFATATGLDTGTADGQPIPDASGNGGNPDGDNQSNLLEHAFCADPNSGVPTKHGSPARAGFCAEWDTSTGLINAYFVRPQGIEDVMYTLQGTTDLVGSWTDLATIPAGGELPAGMTATPNGDGTETVTFSDLGNSGLAGLTGDFGLVRVSVSLDTNPKDGVPDTMTLPSDGSTVSATDYSKIFGWQSTPYNDYQCATFSTPFSTKPAFSGTFADTGTLTLGTDGSGNVTLDVSDSAMGADLSTIAGTSGACYLQMTSGVLEGYRFDILAGGVDSLTLVHDPDIFDQADGVESLNTMNGLPVDGDFLGSSYEIIRYRTIDEVFSKDTAFAGEEDTNVSDATRLLFYNNRRTGLGFPGFETLMLEGTSIANSKWILTNDLVFMTDQGGRRLDPCGGNWVHPKSSGDAGNPTVPAPVQIMDAGMVAEHDQACALPEDYSLIGAMWPMVQTPAGAYGRNFTIAAGFDGALDPTTSTETLIWKGDLVVDDPLVTLYSEGYFNYMLASGSILSNWVDINDINLNNLDGVIQYQPYRAALFKLMPGDEKIPHIYPQPGF